MILQEAENTEQFLSGGGEMGKLIRSMDWSKTPLGPVETWPQSLRTSVSLCLSSTFPILIAWGPETIQIYNDSYRPICGAMHPQSMGMNFRICWESALEVVGDKFTRGQQGEGTYIKDQQMFLFRYGYLEEAFMTFSFAPIRDESGGVGGIFHPITETTDKMLSARRTQVLRDLGAAIGKAKSIEEIGRETESKYQEFVNDLPFILFYQYDAEAQTAGLLSAAGISQATQLAPQQVSLNDDYSLWPFTQMANATSAVVIDKLDERFGQFACAPYPEAPHTAVMLPIHISGQETPFGFLVAGVSSRRALDEEYLGFYDLLGNTYNTAVSNVYAYEQEQKRAEALAQIDRSKTAFFSNVSHEFRTPLTLMLGQLEDIINKGDLNNLQEPIESTHRNALRLLKLVNNLLDYSRVEAGRVKAVYQPVDLCELTTDLASSFRSIIEKAGMALRVEATPLRDRTYVDKQMWEKIVLNLLSNAFKYTLEGSINISLQQVANQVVLKVQDTGVGIPEKELPHMFERFHRVENTAGRTHEGTGIGLSLVHELVSLHQGTISVTSEEGVGSTFTVNIPVGYAHLPQDQINDNYQAADSTGVKGAFLKEAYSLLEDTLPPNGISKTTAGDVVTHTGDTPGEEKTAGILIADDNADMRNYLARLLEPYFTVQTARNGHEALTLLQTWRPDLILSDMMMPVMDGKALLGAVRNSPALADIPLIFLSARAGEEARIDGLEAGADDYLVKPFSAAELLTKIRAQIKLGQSRSHNQRELKRLFIEAPVAIAMYKGPGHIIEVANEKMLAYWGRTEASVLNQPLFEAIPELLEQGFDADMQKVYHSGERFISGITSLELNRFGKRETVFVKTTMEALRDDRGAITGIMAVAYDVTELVTSKQLTERAEERMRLATEGIGIVVWDMDITNNRVDYSPRLPVLFGFDEGQVLSIQELVTRIHPEDKPIRDAAFVNALITGDYEYEVRTVHPNGSIRWIFVRGSIFLQEGEPNRMLGITLDITDRKLAEANLKERDDMLRLAVESADMGTWAYDPHTSRIASSERTKTLFGLRFDEELTIAHKMDVIVEADRERVGQAITAALQPGGDGHYDEEYRVIHLHTKRELWLRATGKTTFDDNGQPVRFAGTVVDFTDRKLDEIRKNDFLAMASHELKTPLTSIKAYIQVLAMASRKLDNPFITNALKKADLQTGKMTRLVNDFLDLSKMEDGKLQLHNESFDLGELVSQVIDEVKPLTDIHPIVYTSRTAGTVFADRNKIDQVISNLLTNAIKYSPAGGAVQVSSKIEGPNVRVDITDSGIGIHKDDQANIFRRFYRAETQTNHFSGFGIGLYVSAEIINRHGGEIGVNSQPGKGSNFYFLLPLQTY